MNSISRGICVILCVHIVHVYVFNGQHCFAMTVATLTHHKFKSNDKQIMVWDQSSYALVYHHDMWDLYV